MDRKLNPELERIPENIVSRYLIPALKKIGYVNPPLKKVPDPYLRDKQWTNG